jgi:hypothetical protein
MLPLERCRSTAAGVRALLDVGLWGVGIVLQLLLHTVQAGLRLLQHPVGWVARTGFPIEQVLQLWQNRVSQAIICLLLSGTLRLLLDQLWPMTLPRGCRRQRRLDASLSAAALRLEELLGGSWGRQMQACGRAASRC